MPLVPGTTLGPYEIVVSLGDGGMGEVYRARDTRLARDVAVKVLPQALARDGALLARFENEARAVSALSHPNIVTVFDVGREGELSYFAMELVPGESLRALLEAGAPPLRKALQIAAQLADGLAAAHARGLVHRDLKPENVIVSREGRVKILDFGLAKLRPGARGRDATLAIKSPAATEPGTVLGTVGYMSPEQASGDEVDHRSDQFALGAILYELLSGRRAFHAGTAAETMAAVIRDEPQSLAAAAPLVPAPVRWLVERCLAKEPSARWDSTRDLASDLWSLHNRLLDITTAMVPAVGRRRHVPAAGAFAAGALAASVVLVSLLRREGAEPALLEPLTHSGNDVQPAVSPDGLTLAYTSFREGSARVYLKQLASGSEVPITEGPRDQHPRFFPDGASLLFVRTEGGSSSLYRVPTVGGQPRRVLANVLAAEPSPDGRRLAFVRQVEGDPEQIRHEIGVVASDGGAPRTLARLRSIHAVFPRFSPDGRRLAITVVSGRRSRGSVVVLDAETGAEVAVLPAQGGASYGAAAWASGGKAIVFGQGDGVVLARLHGPLRRLLSTVRPAAGIDLGLGVDLLPEGGLVYEAQSARAHLAVVDLQGGAGLMRLLTRGDGVDRQPAFSPDGKRIVFVSNRGGTLDLWDVPLEGGGPRRLTEDAAEDGDPTVGPDGRLFWASRRGGVFEIWSADGDGSSPHQVSRDGVDAENPTVDAGGESVIYVSLDPKRIGLWRVRADGTAAQRMTTAGGIPAVSPDGAYVAYVVFASGDSYLRVLSAATGAATAFEAALHPIAPLRGLILGRCRWTPDGRAIAFVGQDTEGRTGIFVQDFDPLRDTGATRRKLAGFEPDAATESFAFSPDGRWLVVSSAEIRSQLVAARGIPGLRR